MKLRIISLLLALTLVFSMLTGCQPSVPVVDPTTESTSETGGSEPSSDPTLDTEPVTVPGTTEPDIPIVAPADFFTANGQSALPASAEIPASCTETLTPHLYACPLDLPQTYAFWDILPNNGMLYIFYGLPGNNTFDKIGCSLYSLETGKLIQDMHLPDQSVWGPLDDGGLWVVESATLQVTFYDRTGNARIVREAEPQNEAERLAQSITVSADGRYMLASYSEGDPLIVHNLETGKQTVPVLSQYTQFENMQETENGFLLMGLNGSLVLLDPASGKTEIVDTDREIGTLFGGLNAGTGTGKLSLNGITPDSECFYMKLDIYEWVADIACGCAVTQLYYPEPTLRFYDLRNGLFISEITFSSNTNVLTVNLLEDGTALILESGAYGANAIYLYNLSAAAGESQTPVETLLYTEEELQAETSRIAAEIEAETGVDLLYGSEGNDFQSDSYVGVAELDAYTVYDSVSTVAEILSRYPDGTLREACGGTFKGLRIYLSDTLYQIGSGRVSSCTTSADGYIVIAVDVNNNLEYDLPYELSYAFDHLDELSAGAGEDEPPGKSLPYTEEELQAETSRIAAEIKAETGVDLIYGSEGNDFQRLGYAGAAELDAYTIYKSVSTVAEILSLYPDGMLREAYEGTHKGLRIYLCGSLYELGAGSVGGVTASVDGYITIAASVYTGLNYTIPHELSHAFDQRIRRVSLEGGTDWMEVWESVNPFEDAYAYTYYDYFSYTEYTPIKEKDPDRVWFVGAYARTFPTEDRACIMERLLNPDDADLAYALQYKNLEMKARLYCYILRQCFPSCNTEEGPFWEKSLGIIDESVLP